MLISIVMPVYDPPIDLLNAAVRSVQSQTHQEWELIIVDDGSRSIQVGEALVAWDRQEPRIRLCRQLNGGASRARNIGTALAVGDYVMYLDADDELSESAVASGVAATEGTEVDLVLGFLKYVETEVDKEPSPAVGHRILTRTEMSDFYDFTLAGGGRGSQFQRPARTVVKNGPVVRLIRRTIAQNTAFPEELAVSEDTIWNLRLLPQIESIALCSGIWYWYWTSHGSTSRGFRADAPAETCAVLDALAATIPLAERHVPEWLVLQRVLGEINRAVRTHFLHGECGLTSSESRREIRRMLRRPSIKDYVSMGFAMRGGVLVSFKYVLCATGWALDYWRWKARDAKEGKRRDHD